MKKRVLSLYCIILTLFCQVFGISTPVLAADANNFRFSNAEFDYALEKDAEGVSVLKVTETLTAEFPDYNQNHGITRSIPYTNQDGKNVTMKNLDSLKVYRNGAPENIAKTERENGNFVIYLGNASEYVHGTQIYTLEYEFRNVITDFSDFQELYWDTNGTGWTQPFDRVKATLHLKGNIAKNLKNENWCYVGAFGEKGEDRCLKYQDENGNLVFVAYNLARRENLTFVTEFKPGTFVVVHELNFALVALSLILSIGCFFIIFGVYRHWLKKAKPKYLYRKGLFTAPQYQPPKDLSVAEAAILSLKSVKPSYVATLLELAVTKKISLIKGEPTKILKKDTWKVKINDTTNLTDPQKYVLEILNGGASIRSGLEITIKKHTATSHLETLARLYRTKSDELLKEKGFFEEKSRKVTHNLSTSMIVIIILACSFAPVMVSLFALMLDGVISLFGYGELVGAEILVPYLFLLILATLAVSIVFGARSSKYSGYTEKGLDTDNYLEGLRLYISMAEKERLEFIQSVKGAPRTKQGIVNLYEKLLPFAALFGLEESWLRELNKYYALDNVSNPDWYSGTDALITFSAFNAISRDISSSISSSTSYSSSSSGGGGGGFSGGGGGGGGGGGW